MSKGAISRFAAAGSPKGRGGRARFFGDFLAAQQESHPAAGPGPGRVTTKTSLLSWHCRQYSQRPPHRQSGFTFLALLLIFAAMAGALAAIGPLWHDTRQREKEQDLLFIGRQYRRAIRLYYEASANKQYPPNLDVLLLDDRQPSIRRYLRRPYRDPLTERDQWGLVFAPQGGIMGIYSLAPGTPIKRANFPADLGWADNLSTYADWKFIYQPEQQPVYQPGQPPIAQPGQLPQAPTQTGR